MMNGVIMQNGFLVPSKKELSALRLRAIRSGAWFRALSRVDRVLVYLTIRVADRVRSPVLAKALLSIIEKLGAPENRVSRAIREIGFPRVRKLSLLAQRWGNKCAKNWMFDLSFARFIAIMHIETPYLFPYKS